jgi:hypothetical protein
MLARIDALSADIAELETVIEEMIAPFADALGACHGKCVSHGWTKIGQRDHHSAGKGSLRESGHQHRGSAD